MCDFELIDCPVEAAEPTWFFIRDETECQTKLVFISMMLDVRPSFNAGLKKSKTNDGSERDCMRVSKNSEAVNAISAYDTVIDTAAPLLSH